MCHFKPRNQRSFNSVSQRCGVSACCYSEDGCGYYQMHCCHAVDFVYPVVYSLFVSLPLFQTDFLFITLLDHAIALSVFLPCSIKVVQMVYKDCSLSFNPRMFLEMSSMVLFVFAVSCTKCVCIHFCMFAQALKRTISTYRSI